MVLFPTFEIQTGTVFEYFKKNRRYEKISDFFISFNPYYIGKYPGKQD
jgi:hypothetical protein